MNPYIYLLNGLPVNQPSGGSWVVASLTVTGNETVGGTLQVNGPVNFASTLTTGGDIEVDKNGAALIRLVSTAASGKAWLAQSYSDGSFYITHQGVTDAIRCLPTSGNVILNGVVTVAASGAGVDFKNASVNTAATSIYGGSAYNTGAGITLCGNGNVSSANAIKFTIGAYSEIARFEGNNGNLLLKSDGVDSSNGRLQLATHTTSAGGIGFGTDVSLFRDAANSLFASTNSLGLPNNAQIIFGGTGNVASLASLIFKTGGTPTTALTLDNSQNATFAGSTKIKNQATINANGTVGVGTSATTIFSSLNTGCANWCWVFGDDGSSGFADYIVTLGAGLVVTVLSTAIIYGAPPVRVYTTSGTNLRLALASGSMNVRTTSLNTGT